MSLGFIYRVQMGLCTGFGGSAALVSLIGYTKALDFLLSGRKLNPEEGMRLGYYDATVSTRNPLGECEEWMEKRLASTAPEVIRTIKAVLRHASHSPGTVRQCCGSASPDADPELAFHFHAFPDPTFHFNADTDPAFFVKILGSRVSLYGSIVSFQSFRLHIL